MRILTIIFYLTVIGATAQRSPTEVALDSTQTLVRRFYNANQPDRIYALTNEDFRRQISAEQFNEFITSASAGLGRWQSSALPQLVGVTWHYKAFFRKTTMDFLLQLDSQQKISLFALKPHQSPVTRKTSVLTNNPLRSWLDRQVDTAMHAYVVDNRSVGLSVGILRNDSLFVYGYGETAKNNGRIPDGHTLYEIGSVTKTFTAALLADAVRRGTVRLGDPVSRYLPDSLPPLRSGGKDVTLAMLANHTSGLARMATNWDVGSAFTVSDPYATYDERALLAYLTKPIFAHKPGTTYEYSNLATGLLGTILVWRAGKPYEQLIADVITQPLRLNDTKITSSATDPERLALGYDATGLVAPVWTFRALVGAGGLRSTANDLLRYLQANVGRGPTELAKTLQMTHQQTFANEDSVRAVGLGWNIVNRTGWWWHNGGTGGFRSFVGFNPTRKTAIVLLANSTAQGLDGLDWKLIKAAGL